MLHLPRTFSEKSCFLAALCLYAGLFVSNFEGLFDMIITVVVCALASVLMAFAITSRKPIPAPPGP